MGGSGTWPPMDLLHVTFGVSTRHPVLSSGAVPETHTLVQKTQYGKSTLTSWTCA